MINAAPTTPRSTTAADVSSEQLTLLPNTDVTARFRLSKETRERGLRHVAEIRQMIAERSDAVVGLDSLRVTHHGRAA